MLDFPSPATTGQLYVAGGNTWRFDSAKWVQLSGALALPDAPSDGHTYGRNNAAWTSVDAQIAPVSTTATQSLNNVGRNLVHNPVYTVQQRGTGPWTANGNYTADRWMMQFTNDTVSVSIQALVDADRTAIGDEQAQFCLQAVFTGSSTAGSISQVMQRIENVRRFGNKTVTVSFWARATSGTPRLSVWGSENFGGGGSPSPNVSTAIANTPALSATWTRYTMSATLPSVAGKTFGTTVGTDYLALNMYLSDQANSTGIGVQSGTIQLWGIQLEYGSVATALDKGGSPQAQLAEAQRFYCAFSGLAIGGYADVANRVLYSNILFPVSMRAVPTMAYNGVTNTNCSGPSGTSTVGGIAIAATAAATGGVVSNFNFTASADL